MPRIATFPTTYDELRKFTLSDLAKLGYLKEDKRLVGVLRWKDGASMNVETVVRKGIGGIVTLSYQYNGAPVTCDILLVKMTSNLGQGIYWYGLCPVTGKKCRTFYEYGKLFASRFAHRKMAYESQLLPKRLRDQAAVLGGDFKMERLCSRLFRRYAKKTYRGKPTPAARKIAELEKSRKADG